MRGNSFGRFLVVTTFGESHGPAVGAIIDGCPPRLPLSVEDFARALSRRRPGQSAMTSNRSEPDSPEILSGVFEGLTLGTPIAVIVRTVDARSEDYDPALVRAGHADAVWKIKYGIRDYRGGGRASGRETIARVIGGVVAEKILPPATRIVAFARQIGLHRAETIPSQLTRGDVDMHPTRCPDTPTAERMEQEILRCRAAGDSLGGIAEIWIDGLPAGLGEPVFRKAKSELASALMSIGAIQGVTLGDASHDIRLPGSEFFPPVTGEQNGIAARSYGIQGGITTGERIVLQVFVKPPSTLGDTARTGRHDPCILPRIIPVLEAMTALALADLWLESKLTV